MVEQTDAGIFKQINYQIEAIGSTIIRIGDMIHFLVDKKVGHTHNFLFVIERYSLISKVVKVLVVHSDNQVEAVKIQHLEGS